MNTKERFWKSCNAYCSTNGGDGGGSAEVLPPLPVLTPPLAPSDELQKILQYNESDDDDDDDIELANNNTKSSSQPNNNNYVKSTLV